MVIFNLKHACFFAERITAIANRKIHGEDDIFHNENLPRLIETLKLILKVYESKPDSKH